MRAGPTTTRSGMASATIRTPRPRPSARIESPGSRHTASERRSGRTIRGITRSPGTRRGHSTAAGTDGMRTRRKLLLAGAAALMALLALMLLQDREESVRGAQTAAIVQLQPAEPSTRTQPLAAPPAPPASAAVAPPVFDLVRVEKEEVCEGEENLITVQAHTTDGNDAFLHYTVAGEAGSQVPVRAYLGRDGNPPPQYAVAFSKDNVATRIDLPRYRVKNCRPARILVVTMRMLPNSVGEREFTAAVQTLEGAPFTPAWYEWSFGDGESGVTPGPTAIALDHSRVLRHAEIPPGAFVEESLEYDFGADAAVYAVTFAVQGVTASGMQARGELALLRPPPRPTRENSVPIQDPAMIQKIRRAMAILNQETVSQEDIWRLEREGKLQ